MSNVKNVEAFGKLTGICTGYGGSYNPGQPNLQVTAMNALLGQARAALNEVHLAQTSFENMTNTREVLFKEMVTVSSRAINFLRASGASPLTIQDALSSFRKLYSRKAPVLPAVAGDATAAVAAPTRKARGLDYASLTESFAKLIDTLASVAEYQPNEPELTIAALTNLLNSLRAQNDAVNVVSAALHNARKKRTLLLYTGSNNLVSTARAAKRYVRSAFGHRSLQRVEISGINFTKPVS